MAKGGVIRAEDFIDISDLGNIDKIIDGLDRFNKALVENGDIRKSNAEDLSKVRKKEISDLKKLEKQLESTKNLTEEGRQQTIELTNAAEEKAKAMEKLKGVEQANKKELKKIAVLEKKVLKLKQDLLKVSKEKTKESKKENKQLSEKEKVQKKLVDITTEEAAEIAKLNIELQEQRKEQKKAAKEALGLTTEYQKQSEHLRTLKNEYKDATLTGSKTRKELNKMRKAIVKLDNELVDLDESVKDSFRNIGKYEKSVEKLEKDLVKFAAGALLVGGALKGLQGGLEATEEGSEDLRKATGALDAASNEGKKTLGTFALELFDFAKGVAKGEKELGGLVTNIVTLSTSFVQTAGSIQNLSDNVDDSITASLEATEATINLEKSSRDYLVQVEILTGAIERQNSIAGDSTRSFIQIQEASEKAIIFEKARALLLQRIAQEELNIINNQIKARGEGAQSIDLLNQQSQKEIELIGLKNDVRLAELELNKQIVENASDLAEQELDFTLDIGDRQKAVNERRLQDDQLTLDAKFKIFEETTKILDDSFQEQLKITENFVAKSLEINEGLTGEEARKKVEAINLETIIGLKDEREIRKQLLQNGLASEKINNRIREIIVERQAAVQDLADIERDLNAERREASRTLAADLEVLTQVFKGEGLQIDNVVIDQLTELGDELKALDEDLTINQGERLEQREAILARIQAVEKKAVNDGLKLATEELEERRAILSQELDDIRSGAKDELESREDIAKQILEIDQQITDAKQSELDKQFEAIEKNNAKEIENEKEKQAELDQLRKEVLNQSIALFNQSAELVSTIFDNQIAKQEAQGEELARQKEHELLLAGDNANRRIEIEEEFFKREEAVRKRTVELQRKQAIFDKAVAITNATVNTALAVAQINANPAVNLDISQTLRTVLTALVLATGAAQIATIAAAPIPQFWKGTDSAPGGLAIVDEKGAEIRTDKKGRIKDLGKGAGARVVMTDPGDKIYTAGQTRSINSLLQDNPDETIPGITQRGFNDSRAKLDKLAILERMNNNQMDEGQLVKAFGKAISKQPIHGTTIDENGFRRFKQEENSRVNYLKGTKLGS